MVIDEIKKNYSNICNYIASVKERLYNVNCTTVINVSLYDHTGKPSCNGYDVNNLTIREDLYVDIYYNNLLIRDNNHNIFINTKIDHITNNYEEDYFNMLIVSNFDSFNISYEDYLFLMNLSKLLEP